MIESPAIAAVNLHIDALNLGAASQYDHTSMSGAEGVHNPTGNMTGIEKTFSIDSTSAPSVPSALTDKGVATDQIAVNDGRDFSYPEPPTSLGESLERRASCHPLMSDQLSLVNISADHQETPSPAASYEWDILRSSRMDWLGCETETSDAMTNASPRRPEDLHQAQHLPAGITGPPTQSLTNLLPTGSLAGAKGTQNIAQGSGHLTPHKDQETTDTWPHVLDRGGNDSWPFDYTSNKGFRKITLPPLRQVLEQTVGDRPAIESTTLMDLIKVLSCPQIPSFNDSPALEALPAVSFLGEFVKIYFAEFHPVAPIIHKPTWRIEKCQTALLAAMACIGATYSTAEGSQEVAALLAEITQRALFWMVRYSLFVLSALYNIRDEVLDLLTLS